MKQSERNDMYSVWRYGMDGFRWRWSDEWIDGGFFLSFILVNVLGALCTNCLQIKKLIICAKSWPSL